MNLLIHDIAVAIELEAQAHQPRTDPAFDPRTGAFDDGTGIRRRAWRVNNIPPVELDRNDRGRTRRS